jgi:hypothetical protein
MGSRYPDAEGAVRARFVRISPTLDERGRRLFAANEALAIGYGGDDADARAPGVANATIRRGVAELRDLEHLAPPPGRPRKAGAGGPLVERKYPGLLPALDALVEPATRSSSRSRRIGKMNPAAPYLRT